MKALGLPKVPVEPEEQARARLRDEFAMAAIPYALKTETETWGKLNGEETLARLEECAESGDTDALVAFFSETNAAVTKKAAAWAYIVADAMLAAREARHEEEAPQA